MKNKISITLDENIISGIDALVDGIYIRNKSQAIEYLLKKTLSGSNKAIFLCGGTPKRTESGKLRPCANFLGTPSIIHNIRFLRSHGFREIIIVANKTSLAELENEISHAKISGVEVKYHDDGETSQGSMDSLRRVKGIDGTTLVVFGDQLLINSNMQNFWKTHLIYKAEATLYVQAFLEKTENAGVVSMEGNLITSFVQKPGHNFSLIHFSGTFIMEPEMLHHKGHSLEYDIFPELAKNKKLVGYLSEKPIHHFHTDKEIAAIEKLLKSGDNAPRPQAKRN
ncbi:MAG: sugar phosphate nucleotidyltransferase [archaeon]